MAELGKLPEGARYLLLAPHGRRTARASTATCSSRSRKAGFARVRVDGVVVSLEDDVRLDKKKKHNVEP